MIASAMERARRALYIVDYCLSPEEHFVHAAILTEGESILAIGGASAFDREEGLEVIELPGCYALPGLIDTHIHGAGGFDSTTPEAPGTDIGMMSKTLASHGITAFVPTVISLPRDRMLSAISFLSNEIGKEYDGACPVGIHVEGPFLNRQKHGSQDERDIRPIDLGEARELLQAGHGAVRTMTFAPELEQAVPLVELLLENNVVPAMGHSLADEAAVLRAVDAGARRVTHIFNGMPPLHQRAVGLTAVALTDDRLDIEIILDGAHLHPRMVDLVCRSKPIKRIIGVSDAIQGAGLLDGTYHLGPTEINVRNGRSTTPDGVLAGTTLMLERGWRHLMQFSHIELTDAASCLTLNPARSIGLTDRGELHPGKRADIAIFDTRTNNTRMVVCRGRTVYDSQAS
jgi:N-acetylglucosamine-6-phosphate deacetylase